MAVKLTTGLASFGIFMPSDKICLPVELHPVLHNVPFAALSLHVKYTVS